jgi:hypothetical protein
VKVPQGAAKPSWRMTLSNSAGVLSACIDSTWHGGNRKGGHIMSQLSPGGANAHHPGRNCADNPGTSASSSSTAAAKREYDSITANRARAQKEIRLVEAAQHTSKHKKSQKTTHSHSHRELPRKHSLGLINSDCGRCTTSQIAARACRCLG